MLHSNPLHAEAHDHMLGFTSKCGAEGISCFSLPDGRWLAVKVVDGADRAHEPAGLAAFEAVVGAEVMTDELRRIASDTDSYLLELEARERERTGLARPGNGPTTSGSSKRSALSSPRRRRWAR